MKGSYFSEGRCLVPRLDWIGAVFRTLLVAVREVLGAVLDLMVLFFGATISSCAVGAFLVAVRL